MVRYDPLDKLLKTKDVAEILNTNPNTIRRWSEQGKIEASVDIGVLDIFKRR
jgi:uncharacterized protein YjcR